MCRIIPAVFVLCAGLFFASAYPAQAELYVGFQTGVDRADVKTGGVRKDKRGFEGGGLLGYEFFFGDGWFAGGEGFFHLRSFKEAGAKSLYRYGLSAVAGRQVMPLLDVFAFIGPQWVHWDVKGRETTTGSGANQVVRQDAEFKDTIVGFQLGIGARYVISPSWQVRTQYRYSRAKDDYARVTIIGDGNNARRVESELDIPANSHVVSLGFTYTF